MALGALIIQQKFQYSDRELVEQITENPYLQYFIGLPGYQEEAPFDASTLVLFRKRINAKMLMDANEAILAAEEEKRNLTTMIIQILLLAMVPLKSRKLKRLTRKTRELSFWMQPVHR